MIDRIEQVIFMIVTAANQAYNKQAMVTSPSAFQARQIEEKRKQAALLLAGHCACCGAGNDGSWCLGMVANGIPYILLESTRG